MAPANPLRVVEFGYPHQDLVPSVCRQRAIIEASGCLELDRFNFLHIFFELLCQELNMQPLTAPQFSRVPVLKPLGNNPDDYGISGFQMWLESGVMLHAWPLHGFMTLLVDTCKPFDFRKLGELVAEYFQATEVQVTNIGTQMTILLFDAMDDVTFKTSSITGTAPIPGGIGKLYRDPWEYQRTEDCYLFQEQPGLLYYSIPERSEIFVRFWFAWDPAPVGCTPTIFALRSSGLTVASIIFDGHNNTFAFQIGSTTVLDSSSPDNTKVFFTNRFYDIDVRFKLDSINGVFETRYGAHYEENFVADQEGLGTIFYGGNTIPAGLTITGIDEVAFGMSTACPGITLGLGNFIINDTLGSQNTSFMHATAIEYLFSDPWDAGSYDNWRYIGTSYKGSNNMFSSGAYISTYDNYTIDSYAADEPGGYRYFISWVNPWEIPDPNPVHIVALETVISAKKSTNELPLGLQHVVVVGATYCEPCWYSEMDTWYAFPGAGTAYLSPEQGLTTNYKLYGYIWEFNPATGLEWKETDFSPDYMDYDGAQMFQIGVRSWIMGYAEARSELLHLHADNSTEKEVLVLIDGVASETITPDLFHLDANIIHHPSAGAVPATSFNDAVNNAVLEFSVGNNTGNDDSNWAPTLESDLIAAQSGPLITVNKNCYFLVDVTGPGTIDFWWAVDCANDGSDLEFWIDNERYVRISGEHSTLSWAFKSYTVGEGRHEFAWNFINYTTRTAGRDAGFVRDVGWTGSQNWLPLDSSFNNAVTNNDLKFVRGGVELWDVTSEPGVTAVQSGDMDGNIYSLENSWFTTTVEGPGYISFEWAVDSESYDKLEFYIDYIRQEQISGTHSTLSWIFVVYEIGNGLHTFKWNYYKNTSGSSGRDAGFVRNIEWSLTEPEPPASFNDAVNNHVLSFTLGGDALWAPTDEPGLTAAESGNINDNQSTWFTTTVTGPGTISFWWATDSEGGYDYLEFWIDTTRQDRISGDHTVLNFAQKSIAVGSGTHTLKWNYMKDSSYSDGRDAGFVKDIVWTPS